MTRAPQPELRWDPYVLRRGAEFATFWGDRFRSERDVLLITSSGFDPRSVLCPQAILAAGGAGRRDALLVDLVEAGGETPSPIDALSASNLSTIREAFSDRGDVRVEPVSVWTNDGHRRRRVGSQNARRLTADLDLDSYGDVIVDVSALPRSIYFPILGGLLARADMARASSGASLNLHVVVAENADIDQRIQKIAPDETASYVPGFSAEMELESVEGVPKVWIPVLGEGRSAQLERIYNLIQPDEVSPLLPSPSYNPRRSDDLIVEYQELLFDRWQVGSNDLVYASERNPFEVYRQIVRTVQHHHFALGPLDGCRAAVSALSSKLLSLGALLAAYDSKSWPGNGAGVSIALAHVDVGGYDINDPTDIESETELFTLWLTGDCYE